MKIKVIVGSVIFLLIASLGLASIPKVKAAGSPTINSITTNHADGNFKSGEVVNFNVTYSEAVNVVGGTPTIILNSGGTATYTSGTGSDALVFAYTVGASDNSADLAYLATSSLTTTGTIKSVFDDTDATNDLPDPSIFLAAHDLVIDTVSPSVTKLGDGLSDYTISGGASVELIFDGSLSVPSKNAIELALTNGADKAVTYSWNSTSSALTIIGNIALTTFANDIKAQNIMDLAGNTIGEILLIDSKLESNQVEPVAGYAIINSSTPQAVLTSQSAVNIVVANPVANPSIDATNFVNNGVGIMPNIIISIPGVGTVNVPTSTTFTAASSSWSGIIGAPTITSITLDSDKTLSSAFEVGSTQSKLTFDKGVRIFVLNEGGKRVGYVGDGGAFVEITTICNSDSQSWVDSNLGVAGDCKTDSGSDLVVWTKHFTKFAVYTQASVCSPDSITNGSVSAYPACTITCNSGYTLNNGSCVAQSSGGGGVVSGPVLSKVITSISSLFMPIKMTLNASQTGNLTQPLADNYSVKLSVLEDSVATKTDFSISSFTIGSLKPVTNLGTASNIFEITGINSNGLINNTLLKAADIVITYPNLPTDLSGIGLYYYDSANKKWILISDVVFSNNMVSFSTKNLGKFAIFKSADNTVVKEFTLTSTNTSETVVAPVATSYIAQVLAAERQSAKGVDSGLVKKLAGKIILQVASFGRAWYVDPVSLVRYYLADGPSSFNALRKFGLGIKNTDLSKIPVGIDNNSSALDTDGDGLPDKMEQALGTDINKADTDGDGFSDKLEVMNSYSPLGAGKINQSQSLIQRLKGKIVLQTEGAGQAWYINPGDGKRYYLADGDAAYQIMRQLSLGITNDSINKIPVSK
jgi:Bacterial TSP3 repeat